MGEHILVYRTLPPEQIIAHDLVISAALFGMRGRSDGQRTVSFSEASGCIRYFDEAKMWKSNDLGAMPRNAVDAQRFAEKWLADARVRLNAALRGRTPGLEQLIPQQLLPVAIGPVAHSTGKSLDHWLCVFRPRLPTGLADSQQALLAVDSTLELRIGPSGQLIALVSTWRPQEPGSDRVDLLPAPDEKAQLFYGMQSPESPQVFIGPYYFTPSPGPDEVGGHLVPATNEYSPVVNITQDRVRVPIQLTARVVGVGGSLVYSWGYWRVDVPFEWTRLPTTGAIAWIHEPGVYNAVVDVGRVQRGRLVPIVRGQSLIYAAGSPSGSASLLPNV